MSEFPAPWALKGEAVVALARPGSRGRMLLPHVVRGAPGPALVSAVRHTESPVGPFLELQVSVPARCGPRVGWTVVAAVVDNQDARVSGRLNWGFPVVEGSLRWLADGDVRRFCWEDRGLEVRARGHGPALPMGGSMPRLQQRSDDAVVVPHRSWGRCRAAGVHITVDAGDDELDWLDGGHLGVHVSGVRRTFDPARDLAPSTGARAPAGVTGVWLAADHPLRDRVHSPKGV